MNGDPPVSPPASARPRCWSRWHFLRQEFEPEPGSQVEPYPGLASFQDREADRLLFRGRDAEAAALLNLVQAEDLVLLFSRSGMGKTSLINAGLMEPLRQRGYFPVVVRLTHDSGGDPLQSVFEGVETEAARPDRAVTVDGSRNRRTLWQYFHETRFLRAAATEEGDAGTALRPVLVLDQFEELFTRIRDGEADGKQRFKAFVDQLADLIHHRMPEELRTEVSARLGRLDKADQSRKELASLLYSGGGPDVKIVIAMGEDYLAELETLKPQISGVYRHSLRLEPLTKAQARQAIEEPCRAGSALGLETFAYAPGVVDEMLEFLSRRKLAGRWVRGEFVEPAQLQILCRHLNRRRQERRANAITPQDLGGDQGMKRIIRSYYTRSVGQFPLACLGWNARKLRLERANLLVFNRPRLAVRRLCEHGLITPDGQRNSLALSSLAHEFGITQLDADFLVERKLLRAEERLGSRFYELSHDTLIEPIRTSRRRRRLRELLVRVAMLAAIPLAVSYWPEVVTAWQRHKVFDVGRDAGERIELLTTLVREKRALDFRGLVLTNAQLGNRRLLELQLPRSHLPGADFANSALYQANFARADLAGAKFNSVNVDLGNFARADLRDATFEYASAANANFTGANLTKANFAGTILPGANFANAVLRGATFTEAKASNADFTRADLTDAEFDGADCCGARIDGASFTNANWWMGFWSSNQIQQLKQRWPVDRFAESPRYQDKIRSLEDERNGITQDHTNHTNDLSIALNNLAWYRATHGSQRELGQARMEISQSLKLVPDRVESLDTRGYILLRLGDHAGARSNFQAVVRASESAGYALYHLALALSYLGEEDLADEAFARAAKLEYRPSYELVLTPPRPRSEGLRTLNRDLLPQRQRPSMMKK